MSYYKKAFDAATKYMGATHAITKNMGDVYNAAKEKISGEKEKLAMRRGVPSDFAGGDDNMDSYPTYSQQIG